MRPIIAFLFFFFFFYSYSASAQPAPEGQAKDVLQKFFSVLKPAAQTNQAGKKERVQEKKKAIKEHLVPDIVLTSYSEKELSQMSLKMLNDELSVFQYMKTITGYNIHQFLEGGWALLKYRTDGEMKEDVIKGRKAEKDIKIFYFKCILEIKADRTLYKNRKCEVDFIRDNQGQYKVIGFIL